MRKILSESKILTDAQMSMDNYNNQAVDEVISAIDKNEWVIVGMKQNPFVKKARKHLEAKGKTFHYIEHGSYFSKWAPRLAIKLWSGWATFPQVFHKGSLVGGANDLIKYLP